VSTAMVALLVDFRFSSTTGIPAQIACQAKMDSGPRHEPTPIMGSTWPI